MREKRSGHSPHFASRSDRGSVVPVTLLLSHPPTSPSQATYKDSFFTFVRRCVTRSCRSSLAASLLSPPHSLLRQTVPGPASGRKSHPLFARPCPLRLLVLYLFHLGHSLELSIERDMF